MHNQDGGVLFVWVDGDLISHIVFCTKKRGGLWWFWLYILLLFYSSFPPASRSVSSQLSAFPLIQFSLKNTCCHTVALCLSHPQTPTFLPPARKLILPGDESLVPRNKNWQGNRIVVSCSIVVSDLVLSLACSSILAMGFFLRRLGLPRNKESKMRRDGYSE